MTGSVTRSRPNTSFTRRRATRPILDRSHPSGDRGHDRDLVRLLELGVEALTEPDVLVVEVDVDELAGLAVSVEQPVLEPGVAAVEGVDRAPQIVGLDVHGRRALAQTPKRAGDTELRQLDLLGLK